jgi:transposase
MSSLHQSSHRVRGEAATEIANRMAQLDLAPDAREWVSQLLNTLAQSTQETRLAKLKIDALVLELAHLRWMRFGQSSEAIAAAHYYLFDETSASDVADIEALINNAAHETSSNTPADNTARVQRQGAGRQALPAHLPRIEHRHEVDDAGANVHVRVDSAGNKVCNCKACGSLLTLIGEDVSEQLDVTPAKFFVHRHIRPQYACRGCETVVAARSQRRSLMGAWQRLG